MITRLWSLTLLVTQLVLAYDHKIDLTRCKTETACFIRESCLKNHRPTATDAEKEAWRKNLVQFKDDVVKLENSDCDVVLQIKPLNEHKFHVMMQVKMSGSEKIKAEDGIKLVQGTDQFVCKPGTITGDQHFKLDYLGKQLYEDQRIFCSFTADSPTEEVKKLFKTNIEKPKIIFNRNVEIVYSRPKEIMWNEPQKLIECAHTIMSSSTKIHPKDASLVLAEVDSTVWTPLCSTSFVLKKKSDQNLVETSKFVCDTRDHVWIYGDPGTEISEDFELFCIEKVCQQCKSVPLQLECDGCTSFTPPAAGDTDGCPTLTCPSKKWTLTGKEIIVQGDQDTIECKQSKADATKYNWFLKEAELEKAACLEKIDCGKRFAETPKYPTVPATCTPATDKCTIEGLGTDKLKCKTGHHFKFDTTVDGGDVFELECDHLTGRFRKNGTSDGQGLNFTSIECVGENISKGKQEEGGLSTGGGDMNLYIAIGFGILAVIATIVVIIFYCFFLKKRKKEAAAAAKTQTASAKKTDKTDASTNKSTASSVSSMAPDIVVESSDGKKKSGSRKSKGSKKEKKFFLEDYETWDNEKFNKQILPNFKYCEFDAQTKWVRNCLGRFYAYCNTKKTKEDLGDIDISTISIAQTPESGTFQQFWLLVKHCADDKCVNAGVWYELFRIVFTMGYSIAEKNEHLDNMRILLIKPFETYMLEHLKKCDFFKQKDEPRHVTEMRVICISILIHTRHPEVTDNLRKLTFNEKLEVPLRMLTAACYTRERDEIGTGIQQQYIRVCEQGIVDPHCSEGWGTYLQHCIYGLGGFLITLKEAYQTYLFDAIYQFPMQKSETEPRRFSPTDWLYAYKGACLHENSAKIAMEMFEKMNAGSLLHIETLLKQKYEDPDERGRAREMYKRDMKEYTLLLSTLLIGEEEFKTFQPHLRFVILFVGDQAKCEEPLDEDRIRERAINLHNMIRDRNFAKETCECLRAIGAKLTQ